MTDDHTDTDDAAVDEEIRKQMEQFDDRREERPDPSPNEPQSPDDMGSDETMQQYIDFLRLYYDEEIGRLAQRYPKEQSHIDIDWGDLLKGHRDAAEAFLEDPTGVKAKLADAVRNYDLPADIDLAEVDIHITGLDGDKRHDVGDYSPTSLPGEVRELRGQVAKRTKKRPILETATFICERCGRHIEVPQEGDDRMDEPTQCPSCERQGPYKIDAEKSERSDYQLIRLKEPPERSRGGDGETIDIQLRDDLVDTVRPGDRIRATAEIKQRPERNGNTLKRTMEVYAEGHGIHSEEQDWDEVNVEEHRERVEEIASSGRAFEMIRDSVYPSHHGDEEAKEAITLQMFGGVDKELPDGSVTRGTIHVAFIGDPATDKSGLLSYAQQLTPRSIKTSGKGATGVGLTAAAVQDDFGDGSWTLEAGAVVQADGGLCCVDELDKMDEGDQDGLLGAMSDQEVSVAKAGISATLPANTSILAAANPKQGRFDLYNDFADQFDFHPALLSRFDLIFTFTDSPDNEADSKLAEHMGRATQAGQKLAAGQSLDETEQNAVSPTIEPEVMRAYVAMGREVTPVLTDAARQHIEDEWVQVRADGEGEDQPVPVTARKLDALFRLAEASARIRLSDTITVEDADRALQVHRASLEDIGIDPETGEMDADLVEVGQPKSQRDRAQMIYDCIKDIQKEYDRGAPREKVIEEMAQEGVPQDKTEHRIEDDLMQNGRVYEPNDGFLRTT
jgi:replicative DNA helicase Mcm